MNCPVSQEESCLSRLTWVLDWDLRILNGLRNVNYEYAKRGANRRQYVGALSKGKLGRFNLCWQAPTNFLVFAHRSARFFCSHVLHDILATPIPSLQSPPSELAEDGISKRNKVLIYKVVGALVLFFFVSVAVVITLSPNLTETWLGNTRA